MRISFYVEESPCERNCEGCSEIIYKEEISVRTWYYLRYYYFHLECYSPGLKQYIYKKNLEIWLINPESERKFNSWIDSWNKNYSPFDEEEIDIPMASKFVYSKPSSNRRGWLEIFKFLDAKEISLSISHVNRDFYIISCDEELWYFYLLRDYSKLDHNIRNYRDQYILLVLRTCCWCHNNTDQANIIGNLYNKSLCYSCKWLKRFDKITEREIEYKYGLLTYIGPWDLKFDNSVDGWKRTYRYMLLEELKKSEHHTTSKWYERSPQNNLDLMLSEIPRNFLAPNHNRILKIIIVGDSFVGKTSLINRYVTQDFSDIYTATIFEDYLEKYIEIDSQWLTLQIWDKLGSEYSGGNATFNYNCDCCILVYDITSIKSFDNITSWKEKLLSQKNDKCEKNFSFILLGNKVDKENERKVASETARKWCRENGNIPFYETSARECVNLNDAFMTIIKNSEIFKKQKKKKSECNIV